MHRRPAHRTGNRLLDSLPARELATILQRSSFVALSIEQGVYRPGRPFPHIYFPVDCVLSLVHKMEDGSEAELSSIGREGVASPRPLLGLNRLSSPALCVVPGDAFRLSLKTFLELASECATLRRRVLRYNGVLMTIYAQFSACNRFHQPLQRCSRWLLLAQDRSQRDSIGITHQFLGRLLGLQRPAVSLVISTLQKRGAIASKRGRITIRDRAKLEEASCECYRKIAAEFKRLYR